jgi:SAM-dependent methyltransferase
MLSRLKAAVPLPLVGPATRVVRSIFAARAHLLPLDIQVHQLIRRYCCGQGLEIGPGRHPYCKPKTTKFLEKHPDSLDGYPRPDIVADATDIPLPNGELDYVFSSHVLEHMPDTIRALNEWMRLLRPGGVLFLLLPHADRIFDRHRPKTTLQHHIEDFQARREGPDHSHDEEARAGWERLEDFDAIAAAHLRVFGTGMWDFDHRIAHDAMHYHVWTQDEIVRLLQYLGLKIAAVAEHVERRDSFAVVARKTD